MQSIWKEKQIKVSSLRDCAKSDSNNVLDMSKEFLHVYEKNHAQFWLLYAYTGIKSNRHITFGATSKSIIFSVKYSFISPITTKLLARSNEWSHRPRYLLHQKYRSLWRILKFKYFSNLLMSFNIFYVSLLNFSFSIIFIFLFKS